MKKNILTTIVYHYYLAKAQCSSIKPLFINKFNNRSNIIWMGSIKSIRCCYTDAYYETGLAPIFPYTFYHLTHYWFAAADIPVANDTPVHYADAIRCNVRRPPQGSLPLLTRRVSA